MGVIAKAAVEVLNVDVQPAHIRWIHSNPLLTTRRGIDVVELSGDAYVTRLNHWEKPRPTLLGMPLMMDEKTLQLAPGRVDTAARQLLEGVHKLSRSGIEPNGANATRYVSLDVGLPSATTWRGKFDLDALPEPVRDLLDGARQLYRDTGHIKAPPHPKVPAALYLF
jgi:hypothetical protein